MNVTEILRRKDLKKLEARDQVVQAILSGDWTLAGSETELEGLKEGQIATFLEAVEEITGQKTNKLGVEYLQFAERFILAANNSCKREASRIVGNMAADYPEALDEAIPALLANTKNDGTVVRWSSAYALSRILLLDRFAGSSLVQDVKEICEAEQENGVKNQYAKALKRLKVIGR